MEREAGRNCTVGTHHMVGAKRKAICRNRGGVEAGDVYSVGGKAAMISRRNFTRLALGAIASKNPRACVVNGVALGATGYSFASLSLGEAIEAMTKIGIGNCEVWSRHIEPKLPREELREWRLSAPLELYRQAGEEFRRANIAMIALTFDMKDDFTDGELERVFQMTKALGVNRIATSTTLMVAERITPLMKQFRTEVAFSRPQQCCRPESGCRA